MASGANADAVNHYTPEGGYCSKPPLATSLAHRLEEVNQGVASWTEACFVQFSSAGMSTVALVIKVAPKIPLAGKRWSEASS